MTTIDLTAVRERVLADVDKATEVRRDLHAHPELMFKEQRTSGVVQRELEAAGVQFVAGLAKGTGVVAHIPATIDHNSAKTVGLRADMDALPIIEATGAPHASTNPGVMHACGHDGHTSILMSVARVLSQTPERPNNVTLLFQPAEEGGAGGDLLVRDGALNGSAIGTPVDHLYGLHGWPMMPLNSIATKKGPLLASCDEFWITITGRGGHAAMPHLTADPVVCAAQTVTAMQSIVSRNANPVDGVVISVTDISTPNDATNVIPPFAKLTGTTRTLSEEHRDMAEARIRELAQGIAASMGCKAEIEYHRGYPVTTNHADAVDRFVQVADGLHGEGTVQLLDAPFMGAEDFSYYCREVPSCFFLIGLAEGDSPSPGLHTPQFDFNDRAIPRAVETFCRLALEPMRD